MGLPDGLAVVHGFHLGQKLSVFVDAVGDFQLNGGTGGRLHSLPAGEGGPGGRYGTIHILFRGLQGVWGERISVWTLISL